MSAGDTVARGDTLIVVSAMKMETRVGAPCSGVVTALSPLSPGDVVAAGQVVAVLTPVEGSDDRDEPRQHPDEQSWAPLLAEIRTLRDLAEARLAPGSQDPGVVRQRNRGKLTCRERITLLLDAGSFHEVGSAAGFASYDEDGGIAAFTPANNVGGWGKIDGRTAIVVNQVEQLGRL